MAKITVGKWCDMIFQQQIIFPVQLASVHAPILYFPIHIIMCVKTHDNLYLLSGEGIYREYVTRNSTDSCRPLGTAVSSVPCLT